MKTILAVLLAATFYLGACNNDKRKTTDNEHAADSNHVHSYSCPMHPEVTGHEGDKCPKCGMALEHNDNPKSTEKFKMMFQSEPSAIQTGKEATLKFTPRIEGKESEQVPLDLEHEKKIHLIMVSEDLSWFAHEHPEFGNDGAYTLKFTFPNAGRHILFSDYKPSGADHQLEKTEIEISGKTMPAKIYSNAKLTGKDGAYELELVPSDGKFETGTLLHIQGKLRKNGKAVDPNTIEDYLGAKAHMVVIGVEDKNYMHVHPDVANGAFDLHTTFDKPGIYRGWVQFKAEGKIYTTDFVINVVQGSGKADHTEHDHKDHGHQH